MREANSRDSGGYKTARLHGVGASVVKVLSVLVADVYDGKYYYQIKFSDGVNIIVVLLSLKELIAKVVQLLF